MSRSFQSTYVIETGLSNFHLMTLTVMRKKFRKDKPRIINYRPYNDFSNAYYRKCLFNGLKKKRPLSIMIEGWKNFVIRALNF